MHGSMDAYDDDRHRSRKETKQGRRGMSSPFQIVRFDALMFDIACR